MQKPQFYSAAYMIIENELWEVLFSKRANTGYRDWGFQLPAGHLEWEESMIECAIRESKEELCIDIKEEDLSVVHISHRISPQEKWWDTRVYFDIYVKINKYSWMPIIWELEKCSELKFVDINNISKEDKNLFSFDLDIVKKIRKGENFSEVK